MRLVALGVAPEHALSISEEEPGVRPSGARTVYADGELVEAPVRTRASIGVAAEPGPLLVDEYDTTVVVPPGWSVRRYEVTASLILERAG